MSDGIMMFKKTCVWLVAAFILAARAEATDYFVNLAGSDGNQGTSSTEPWQTLARVTAARLNDPWRTTTAGSTRPSVGRRHLDLRFNGRDHSVQRIVHEPHRQLR